MKNYLLAILIGTVALFGLGYLIYEVLFGDATFHQGVGAGTVSIDLDIKLLLLMEVLYAILLTLIFGKWGTVNSFSEGVKKGFIVGVLLGATSGLFDFATTSLISINGLFFAAATWGVRFAIAGGLIANILSRNQD